MTMISTIEGTGPAAWYGQYIWSLEGPPKVATWRCQRIGRGYLASHPDLPVIPVSIEGQRDGALVGWPVLNGDFLTDISCASLEDFEKSLEEFGGRWLYIGNDRVITDPFASQPCVYRPERGQLASSVNLISTEAERDDDLVSVIVAATVDFFYPFGLTNRKGVRRLLANQQLCVPSFCVRRWNAFPEFEMSLQEAASEIAKLAALSTKPFHEQFGVVVPLTAGFDSRMLLACLRDFVGEAAVLTIISHTRTSEIDVDLALAMAKRLRLPHTLHPKQESKAAILEWDKQTGRPTGGAVRKGNMLEPPFRNRSFLSGFGGEHAKAYYLGARGAENRALDVAQCLELLRLPRHARIEAAAEEWLAELPPLVPDLEREYLYIEQKTGSWGSPQVFMPPRAAPRVFSFNHRRIIGAMLAPDVEDRQAVNLHREVIRQEWPELLEWPFNDFVGWKASREFVLKNVRHYSGKVMRIWANPK